jgi:hypothetical protein
VPMTEGQCLITVREDWLEVSAALATLWISNLYIQLKPTSGPPREASTVIGVQKGDLYLTNVTFEGDGNNCRAIDVVEEQRLYARGAPLSPW